MLEMFFLQSVERGPAAYASKAKIWPRPWCPFPTLLTSEPRVNLVLESALFLKKRKEKER